MGQVRSSRNNQRGQTKIIDIECLDRNDNPIDPITLTATVLDPDDPLTLTTYTYGEDGTWSNPSAGIYTFEFTPDTASDVWPWEVRIVATTDDDEAASHAKIYVDQDRFEAAE